MLDVKALHGGYGRIEVLRGIDVGVRPGEIVALLGSNGAGKTTLNNTLSGLLPSFSGTMHFADRDLTGARYTEIVAAGLVQVPEGRRVFPNLTVQENLELGSYRRARAKRTANLERVFGLFPRLKDRSTQSAGTLSGGEQQMLAIGRGLMTNPDCLIMDEPSEGLAPIIIQGVWEAIGKLRQEGLSILLVEQNAALALKLVDYVHVMSKGRVVYSAPPADLWANDAIKSRYLGI